jgi:hypothetical protein
MNQTMREMPRYVCSKMVWALRIAEINIDTLTITPADEGYAPFEVDREYVEKHRPQAGGYYVVYADGYRSYSPMKAFVEGYKRMDGTDPWANPHTVDVEATVVDGEVEHV